MRRSKGNDFPRQVQPAYAVVRSLVLAVSTLAIMGVMFAVYQYSTGIGSPPTTAEAPTPPPPPEPSPEVDRSGKTLPLAGGQVGGGERVFITLYEPDSNRARAELEVADYEPTGGSKNELHVWEPIIRIRTPNGQLIRVAADEGWIQLAGRDTRAVEPRSGRFVGSVSIDVDRLSERQRSELPPDQRDHPDEDRLIHLEFEEITFDLQEARLDCTGAFTLSMSEATLAGVGLRLRYNDVDGRVELLEITELRELVIRAARELFDISIPGTSEVKASQPVESSDSTVVTIADVRPGDVATEQPPAADQSDEIPLFVPDKPDKPKVWPLQTYLVEIDREVTVRQMVDGETVWSLAADKLDLLFDFGQQQREAARKGRLPEPGSTDGENPPSSGGDASPPGNERVVLNCSGSFVLRPAPMEEVGGAEILGQRLRLTASGDEVRFSDARASVSCAKLEVRKESGQVSIVGTLDDPVVLRTTQFAELVATEVFMDRQQGVARITGPARLASFPDQSVGPDGDELASVPGEDMVIPDMDIRFDDLAELTLGAHTLQRVNPVTNKLEQVEVEYISAATFSGNVKIRQGSDLIAGDVVNMDFDPPTESGAFAQNIRTLDAHGGVLMHRGSDQVTCADLAVSFAKDPTGRSVPRFAEAVGDVVISQGTRTIAADDHITIQLGPVIKPKPPFDITQARLDVMERGVDPSTVDWSDVRWDYEQKIEYTVGLRSLVAAGNVTAHDPSQNMEVTTEKLTCDFTDDGNIRAAHLTGPEGRDSYVHLGDFAVNSHEIDVDFADQRVEVFGAGELAFVTYRGLDGSLSTNPQHINVSWGREMVFRGANNTARFDGRVRAVTRREVTVSPTLVSRLLMSPPAMSRETSSFSCDELVIDFANTTTSKAPKEEAGEQWWVFAPLAERWGASSDSKGPQLTKEPVYLVASRDVKGVFTNTDPKSGRIENRVSIACSKMTVDLRSELMTIPVKGTILIEDYQMSDPGGRSSPRSRTPFGSDLGGMPSQSYLEWSESMSYHFGYHRADFRRDVVLDHRTGGKMAFTGEFLLAQGIDPESLKGSGRRTRLECQSLVVEFTDRGRKVDRTETSAGRMSVSDIHQLDATGGVFLIDDEFTITANRIVKFPQSDLLRVFGFDQQDAEIYSQDAHGPRFRGREFSYNLDTGRVEASGRHQLRVRR